MPATKVLTDAKVRNAKPKTKPYRLYDQDRMFVNVSVAGTKRWYWAYRLAGEDKTLSLGQYPDVSLDAARDACRAAKKRVKEGLSPKAMEFEDPNTQSIAQHPPTSAPAISKHAAPVLTPKAGNNSLWVVADEWLQKKNDDWEKGHADKVRALLERYVRDGALGKLPVKDVQTGDLYELVNGVAVRADRPLISGERKAKAPHSAIILRRALDAVFRLAIMKGLIKTNPMADLRASEVIVKPKVKHNAKLGDKGVIELYTALDSYGGQIQTKCAIELLMLTALRTIEVRGADWSEIDWQAKEWVVPAFRMKRRIEHSVPLSAQALSVLEKLKVVTGGKGWIFANARTKGTYMASTTINAALSYMGFGGETGNWFRAHGCRGSFSSWAYKQGYQGEAIEQQLAHLEPDPTKRAYLDEKFKDERIKIMNAWADYLDEQHEVAKAQLNVNTAIAL